MPASPPVNFFGLGRLLQWKGYHLAIRAFSLFFRQHPDSKFFLVGWGPEEGNLKALARSLGLDSAVIFCGNMPRAEALQTMAQTHVLLHPTHHDSGGWAIKEAMAAGRPAICLNWAGSAMMVGSNGMHDHDTGIINTGCAYAIEVGTDDEVVNRMTTAMSNVVSQIPLMGKAARDRVQECFVSERIVEAYSKLYREIVLTV